MTRVGIDWGTGDPIHEIVILSEAKDLLSRRTGKKQVLRFAQDDKSGNY
ncbi:MAG TPA: hypothetical protein VNX70_12695 [Bryobacteraceae bacterium]|nr:hypothetical protein [Bryobacteraceae bacterium]